MENPLVILFLFIYLNLAIISLVNLLFRYWRSPGLPAVKWFITGLSAAVLFGGVYSYNRVSSGIQQWLLGLVCVIIAANISGTIAASRVRAGKTPAGPLFFVITTLLTAAIFFSILVVTVRILNRMDVM